jgi:hypothetical protein
MEPSPPRSSGMSLPPFGVPYNPRTQVDLGRLAGPPEGITPFMVTGQRRTPTTEEERGSLALEPLTRGTTDLMISDRPATPHPRADPPSPTSDMTNPNPNGSGSGSPPRLSLLGNQVICRVIRLPPPLYPDPTSRQPPRCHHRCASFGLDNAASLVPLLGAERWGGRMGRWQAAQRRGEGGGGGGWT